MSYVNDLLASYRRHVSLPWPQNVAPAQRVWMAVYAPEYERRIRLNVPEFGNATAQAGHSWETLDISTSFETWMASHDYRDEYFEEPELLEVALPQFQKWLVERVRERLSEHSDPNGVVGLIGAGTLFGLGDTVKVSALLDKASPSIAGRLLVFFPGQYDQDKYRLLDARDGWDYLATPITAEGASR